MAEPRADLDAYALRAALRAQGYALLPAVYPTAAMDRLSRELDRARRREEERFGLDLLREIGQEGYVSDFLAIGPALIEVLESDPLDRIVTALLGEDAHLFVGQGIVLDPGMGRGVWPRCWHADMYGVRREVGDPSFCFGVNCLLFVDELTADNGPTAVLPGSHGLDEMAECRQEELAVVEVRATAPSGSLLLIDGGVWHSAGFNRSRSPRRAVKMLFTRSWIRPQVDYAALASEDLRRSASPHLRRRLGLAPVAEELAS